MMNSKVKSILVPTDFSDCSQAAVEHAISLARTLYARIFLVHVMEPPVYGLDFSLTHPGLLSTVRHKLVEMMQQLADRMKNQGIEAEGYFVMGVPFVEIIKAAKKHKADLIVMGTHGRTGFAHILLGSTAERVIQRAHCPVLTVKAVKGSSIPTEKGEIAVEEAHSTGSDVSEGKSMTFCHLCAQPSEDIVCEACKVRVQAEAFDRKQRIEKEGYVETGRRKMDPDAQWR